MVQLALQGDVLLLDEAAESSAAETDFELLGSDAAESSDEDHDEDGSEDPDMALRQQQRWQRALYKPPEPTQVPAYKL